jgi:hypothetical protein
MGGAQKSPGSGVLGVFIDVIFVIFALYVTAAEQFTDVFLLSKNPRYIRQLSDQREISYCEKGMDSR